MFAYKEAAQIAEILTHAHRVVILQADNPDGDSLGSALALEQIIGDMGKQPYLYCGADIPSYLTYLAGWDRVSKELPPQFDAGIIVDTGADSLFENLEKSGQKSWLRAKPVMVVDHHAGEASIDFAKIICNYPVVATGEVIYELAQQLHWPLNLTAKNMLATAILSDSLGLTTESTSARSIHIIGELVEGGVSIAELEQKRRELMRKTPELTHYKGELLQRIEYAADGRIALVSIPWEEIQTYSPLYNPSMLVLDDMRQTMGVQLAIAFKLYSDGHITAKIRGNPGFGVAGELAQHFGGGGHAYASGFKLSNGRSLADVKAECLQKASELLDRAAAEQKV